MDQTFPERRQSLLFKVLAAVILLAGFFLAAEIGVRLIGADTYFQNRFFILNRALDYPDVFERDSRLFWRLRPNQTITSEFFEGKTYAINSLGLRGPEPAALKSTPRLMAIGNSCTFGWGVDLKNTYLRRLGRMCNGRYETINGAIPGYTSLQGKRFLADELVRLEPDVLLVLFAWNDHWAAAGGIADKDQQFPPAWILGLQNSLARLHSYRLLKKGLLSLTEHNPDSLFNRENIVYRVGPEDFKTNLEQIVETGRTAGARVILLTSPIPALNTYYPPGSRSNMHSFHYLYNDIIRTVASHTDADLIDLAKEFDRHSSLFDDAAEDPIHFNAEGHRLAAETIFRFIADTTNGIMP